VTGHEGGQGGGASSGDLKLLGVTLGAKEKVGGDKVENQELGAESLQPPSLLSPSSSSCSTTTMSSALIYFTSPTQQIYPVNRASDPGLHKW
jgi:hypothetical protein